MARGFYSVVQYCPDRFRAEAVNVGLVLLCLDPHGVRVETIGRYNRVRSLFGIGGAELKNVKLATRRLKNRIEAAAVDLRTDADLAAFAASRANDLRLTEPRLAKIGELDQDFERLFSELVEEHSAATLADASPTEVLPPSLADVFYRLQQERRIWKPGTITVPVYNRKLDIPYAYKNGIVNLVKPHVFPENRRAETQAAMLAVDGDLIKKYPINGERQELIVVSTQETDRQAKEINDHVAPLFREYGVRLIRPGDTDTFASEVEASAH